MSHIVLIHVIILTGIAASLHYKTAKGWKHKNPTLDQELQTRPESRNIETQKTEFRT